MVDNAISSIQETSSIVDSDNCPALPGKTIRIQPHASLDEGENNWNRERDGDISCSASCRTHYSSDVKYGAVHSEGSISITWGSCSETPTRHDADWHCQLAYVSASETSNDVQKMHR